MLPTLCESGDYRVSSTSKAHLFETRHADMHRYHDVTLCCESRGNLCDLRVDGSKVAAAAAASVLDCWSEPPVYWSIEKANSPYSRVGKRALFRSE
jgi:hypothetical protein